MYFTNIRLMFYSIGFFKFKFRCEKNFELIFLIFGKLGSISNKRLGKLNAFYLINYLCIWKQYMLTLQHKIPNLNL
jgi:hypothetical protein